MKKPEFRINPDITADELFQFYIDNDICELGYGKDVAARSLKYSSLIVGMYIENDLQGIARAMFDGLHAHVFEFCLARDLQSSDLEYDNGSIVEKDQFGYGKQLGITLINELMSMGAYFISATIFEEMEQDVFTSFGLKRNDGHNDYIMDLRPYVIEKIL